MSWVMKISPMPNSRCSEAISRSTCACTVTSSAVVGFLEVDRVRHALERRYAQASLCQLCHGASDDLGLARAAADNAEHFH
jgi:hypothetical protein